MSNSKAEKNSTTEIQEAAAIHTYYDFDTAYGGKDVIDHSLDDVEDDHDYWEGPGAISTFETEETFDKQPVRIAAGKGGGKGKGGKGKLKGPPTSMTPEAKKGKGKGKGLELADLGGGDDPWDGAHNGDYDDGDSDDGAAVRRMQRGQQVPPGARGGAVRSPVMPPRKAAGGPASPTKPGKGGRILSPQGRPPAAAQVQLPPAKRIKGPTSPPSRSPTSENQGTPDLNAEVWVRMESRKSPGTFYYYNYGTAQTSPDPPAPWQQRESTSKPGKFYYWNIVTKDTSVTKPEV